MEKFTYLGMVFTSYGRKNEELKIWMSKAATVMRAFNIRLSWNENCQRKQSSQFSSPSSPMVRILGNDRKNTIASVSVRNEIFAKNSKCYVTGLSV